MVSSAPQDAAGQGCVFVGACTLRVVGVGGRCVCICLPAVFPCVVWGRGMMCVQGEGKRFVHAREA